MVNPLPASLRSKALGLAALAALALAPAPAPAQEGLIEAIRVEGNQRIEDSTVISRLNVSEEGLLEVGDPFDPVLLDSALKSLFETELFADVTFLREGGALVIRVSENPIVNRIAFEGNDRLDDEDLVNEVTLQPRTVFTRSRVRSDVDRLLALYQRSGRFAATVVPKAVLLDQNRVDVVFEIGEGPLTGIERINVIGNLAFSDGSLREEILTRESRWWRFLSSADRYDPDQFEFDQELLRRYYQNNGHPRFRIESASAELRPERDAFLFTVSVSEGDLYVFGEVEVVSDLPEVDAGPLRGLLETDAGDEYDRSAIQETVEAIGAAAITVGQPFVQVRAEQRQDDENRLIHVTYRVEGGPRIYIDRVDIVGNVRTIDRLIRRYVRLAEGDPLNPSLLARSRTLVGNLGYFSNVEFRELPGSAPDRRGIQVSVTERSTGEISFGAGYSTTRGAVGSLALRERNLLGRGQTVSLSLKTSESGHDYSFSFTEPFFLDRDVAFSTSVFNDELDQSQLSHERLRTGFVVGLGFSLGEYLRHNLSYSLVRDETRNRAGSEIMFSGRSEVASLLTATWAYDRRDSAITPTEGHYLRLAAGVAGLGGDKRFFRLTSDGGYFLPLRREEWTLALLYDVGLIEGFGEDVNVEDRFFLGGNSFRGFEYAGVGPRRVESNGTSTARGGKVYATATAEMKFGLGLPEELGMHGRLFTVAGILTELDEPTGLRTGQQPYAIVDERAFRVSAGIGLSWNSPAGPIRIDLTTPLVKEDHDQLERFSFSLGTSF